MRMTVDQQSERDPVLIFRLENRWPCLYCMKVTTHLLDQPEGVTRCPRCGEEQPYKVVWAGHPEDY